MSPRAPKRKGRVKRAGVTSIARPSLNLWGLPVASSPFVTDGVVLVSRRTFDALLSAVERELPRPRRAAK